MNLAERSSGLLLEQIDTWRDAVRTVKQRHPFDIEAMMILLDHLRSPQQLCHLTLTPLWMKVQYFHGNLLVLLRSL